MDQLLLKPEDAARALSLGRSKLYELVAAGELPVIKIGRASRIPASAVRDWVDRRVAADADAVEATRHEHALVGR